jgi:hypothetical protein
MHGTKHIKYQKSLHASEHNQSVYLCHYFSISFSSNCASNYLTWYELCFKRTMLQPQCLHSKQQEPAYLRVGYSATLRTEIVKRMV